MSKCSVLNIPDDDKKKHTITENKLCKIIEEVMGVGETCACCVDVVSQILGKLEIEVVKE